MDPWAKLDLNSYPLKPDLHELLSSSIRLIHLTPLLVMDWSQPPPGTEP